MPNIPFPSCQCVSCVMRRAVDAATNNDAPSATRTGPAADAPPAAAVADPGPLELASAADGGGYDPYNTAARRLGAAIIAKAVRS